MSLEQQIRDAYKTTLGRDVDSDGSLGYWMNQGDNWQSAFQTAAAAEISARPTNYPTLTGTQTQQQQQVANSAQQLYGRTAEQLTATGQGYGTGIGLHPGEGAADPNYMAYKSYNDDMQKRLNEAGRTAAPADAVYRSAATYDPQTGSMVIRDKNGVNLTQWNNGGLIGSDWSTLDRLGVDPASLKAAAAQMQQAGNPQAANYWHSANNYKPLYASAGDAGMLRQGLDPTKDASPFFGASTPSIREFMDRTGLSFEAASGALSSTGLGAAGAALVDWDKVMASPDPARALNAAYAAIAADPRLARIASQAVSQNYAGWNMGGAGVAGDASGGGYAGGAGGGSGGAGTGGGGPLGMPTTGINLSQLQNPSSAQSSGMPTTGINLSQLQGANSWDVQPNQTVQAQLQQIIASDSPLMQQARTRALQTANGRGLLNSTMSQTAADAAMYDAAYPIAAADAGLYGEAARFNADASNTFSRDSNAFTRDAFMADFNLAANEWAKQQDQVRTLSTMDYESRLTLDRDAIQNGYQSARDAIQNGYAINADTRKFNWQSKENALTRTAEEAARVANGAVTPARQVELDTAKRDAARKAIVDARQNLTNILLNTEKEPNLSTESKDTMIDRAVDGYQTIVQAHIAESGWTGANADVWNYKAA